MSINDSELMLAAVKRLFGENKTEQIILLLKKINNETYTERAIINGLQIGASSDTLLAIFSLLKGKVSQPQEIHVNVYCFAQILNLIMHLYLDYWGLKMQKRTCSRKGLCFVQ